jgi:tRNA(Arg) A34 adenosine deaminase TadA
MSSNRFETKKKKKMSFFIDIAVQEAMKSPMEHKHGAVILSPHGGKILSSSFNTYRSESTKRRSSFHAEVNACRQVAKVFLKDAILVIIRINRKGELAKSDPCDNCQRVINKMGLKRVYYS